jgi:hypothetical protein
MEELKVEMDPMTVSNQRQQYQLRESIDLSRSINEANQNIIENEKLQKFKQEREARNTKMMMVGSRKSDKDDVNQHLKEM